MQMSTSDRARNLRAGERGIYQPGPKQLNGDELLRDCPNNTERMNRYLRPKRVTDEETLHRTVFITSVRSSSQHAIRDSNEN